MKYLKESLTLRVLVLTLLVVVNTGIATRARAELPSEGKKCYRCVFPDVGSGICVGCDEAKRGNVGWERCTVNQDTCECTTGGNSCRVTSGDDDQILIE